MTRGRSAFTAVLRCLPHAAAGVQARVFAALALLLTFTFAAPARAQCEVGWLPGVGVPGVSGTVVFAFATLPGGDLVVGGLFNNAGGVAANNIARYNPSTGVWSPLGVGTGGTVKAIAVLPGGDLIVGGVFTSAGGVAASRIARYNPSTGVWSALGAGTNNAVSALAVLPGGDVVVGGDFTNAGGTSRLYIARYNPTSGVWSGLGTGLSSWVYSLAVLPGGDVIVGGEFSVAGGIAASRIARYNPATDTWSALGAGLNGAVIALAVLPNGNIMAGGLMGFSGTFGIARFNPALSLWSTVAGGLNSSVLTLAVTSSGDVIAGGNFTAAGGTPANRIARFSTESNAWLPLGAGVDNAPAALVTLPDGDIIAGGYFGSAGGSPASRFARYSAAPAAPASISSQPSPQAVCGPGTGLFSVGASGAGPLTYQWQWEPAGDGVWVNLAEGENFDGDGLSVLFAYDSTTATLEIGPLPEYMTIAPRSFRCVVTNSCNSVTSDGALFTFSDIPSTPPSIESQPSPQVVCGAGTASFSVGASGGEPLSYQWQWEPAADGVWVDLAEGENLDDGGVPVVSVANTATATLEVTPLPDYNTIAPRSFRCVITNTCSSATSDGARLTLSTADFDGDGDTGTDADIEAFFACLSGNCCLTCSTADFDGDGDTGTDADIESFFRVLSGGNC